MADVNIDVELRAKVDKNFKKMQGQFDALKKKSGGVSSAFNNFSKRAVAATAAIGGMSVAVTGMIDSAIKIEDLETQFISFTGSAASAAKQVERIAEFSASTPFQLEDLANANKSLLAFGVGTEESFVRMKQLGEAAAATGANIGDLAQIFGQVQAAGKLTGERFLQLAERGINIGPALAKSLGVAESELEDLRSAGKITADDFNKAFASMTDEGGQFAGAMERQSRTLSGSFSTLKDNVTLISAAIGKELTPGLVAATNWLINAAKAAGEFFEETKEEKLAGYNDEIKELETNIVELRAKADAAKEGGIFATLFGSDVSEINAEIDQSKAKIVDLLRLIDLTETGKEKEVDGGSSDGNAASKAVEEKKAETAALISEQKKYIDQLTTLNSEYLANEEIARTTENEKIKENLDLRNEEIKEKIIENQASLLEQQGAYEEAALLKVESKIEREKALLAKQAADEKKIRDKARAEEFKAEVLNQKAKAKWEQQTWTERAETTQAGLSALANLQYVGNKQAFEIGKAAAIAQTLVSIPETAQKAFSSLAGIPGVGPALGAAAAAAAVVAGTARINQIRQAKFTKFAEGGLVTGGIEGQDSVPALLTPGEVVVPKKSFGDLTKGMGSNSDQLLTKILDKLDDQLDVLVRISDNTAGRPGVGGRGSQSPTSEMITADSTAGGRSPAEHDRKTIADYEAYWGQVKTYLDSTGDIKAEDFKVGIDQYVDDAFRWGDQDHIYPWVSDPNWKPDIQVAEADEAVAGAASGAANV